MPVAEMGQRRYLETFNKSTTPASIEKPKLSLNAIAKQAAVTIYTETGRDLLSDGHLRYPKKITEKDLDAKVEELLSQYANNGEFDRTAIKEQLLQEINLRSERTSQRAMELNDAIAQRHEEIDLEHISEAFKNLESTTSRILMEIKNFIGQTNSDEQKRKDQIQASATEVNKILSQNFWINSATKKALAREKANQIKQKQIDGSLDKMEKKLEDLKSAFGQFQQKHIDTEGYTIDESGLRLKSGLKQKNIRFTSDGQKNRVKITDAKQRFLDSYDSIREYAFKTMDTLSVQLEALKPTFRNGLYEIKQ